MVALPCLVQHPIETALGTDIQPLISQGLLQLIDVLLQGIDPLLQFLLAGVLSLIHLLAAAVHHFGVGQSPGLHRLVRLK